METTGVFGSGAAVASGVSANASPDEPVIGSAATLQPHPQLPTAARSGDRLRLDERLSLDQIAEHDSSCRFYR